MDTNKCYYCRNFATVVDMKNNLQKGVTMVYLRGELFVYKDGVKSYLKECCFETYICGNVYGNPIDQDQRAAMLSKKGTVFKTLVIGDNVFKVFEMKETKFRAYKCKKSSSARSYEYSRSFITHDSNETYKILTNSELKKHLKSKQDAEISANDMIDVDMEGSSNIPKLNTYIYMIRDSKATALDESIYKVGKTTKGITRLNGYQKGYEPVVFIGCSNCHEAEANILKLFKKI